jgi:hypothetical protein
MPVAVVFGLEPISTVDSFASGLLSRMTCLFFNARSRLSSGGCRFDISALAPAVFAAKPVWSDFVTLDVGNDQCMSPCEM